MLISRTIQSLFILIIAVSSSHIEPKALGIIKPKVTRICLEFYELKSQLQCIVLRLLKTYFERVTS